MTMDFRRMIMLYSDSYKQCHPLMYPDNQEYLVSYLTPRKAMNEQFPKMVFMVSNPLSLIWLKHLVSSLMPIWKM